MNTEHQIRIGPAGWSYADWEGIVYPREKSKGFDHLVYLSRYFDTIEINTTFYRPPTQKMTDSWIRRTSHNPQFQFTAKLWQKFTHEAGKIAASDVNLYKEGMSPLFDSGKLGAVLVQFPWSFKNEDASKTWLDNVINTFGTRSIWNLKSCTGARIYCKNNKKSKYKEILEQISHFGITEFHLINRTLLIVSTTRL